MQLKLCDHTLAMGTTTMSNYSNNDWRNYSELYHHGIQGQKWGVRRFQNSDGSLTTAGKQRYNTAFDRSKSHQEKVINSMYDHANKWTNRKIEKLDAKGKTAKADVMRVMSKKNEEARQEKLKQLSQMSAKDLRSSKNQDLMDWAFGGQKWMSNNAANMTTFLTRLDEYDTQRGMRWMSNFTLEKTLERMSPEEGYEYLRRKNISAMSSGPSVQVQNYRY